MAKAKDLTGMIFGKLTVVCRGENAKSGVVRWWCKCDCNNPDLVLIQSGNLTNGHTKSCGKCSRADDLSGQIFGNWLVLYRGDDYVTPNGDRYTQWMCECQCEKKTLKPIRSGILKSGESKSCGCLYDIKYDLSGEYGIGWTNKGYEFWFDLEDYELIKDYCWYVNTTNGHLVANKTIDNQKTIVYMHKLVIGEIPNNKKIIHVEKNLLDNRKEKLIIGTSSNVGMIHKLSKNNTSGTKGVWKSNQTDQWIADIIVNGKKIFLGNSYNKDYIVEARKRAEEKYFGEFANMTNLIETKQNNKY